MQAYSSHTRTILFLTPALGWGILILYFSSMPRAEVPGLLAAINDKLIHATIYFTLTFLIYFGFLRFNFQSAILRKPLHSALIISVLYGGLMELIQMYLVPGRTGEWLDFFANTAGAVLFVLMLVARHRV